MFLRKDCDLFKFVFVGKDYGIVPSYHRHREDVFLSFFEQGRDLASKLSGRKAIDTDTIVATYRRTSWQIDLPFVRPGYLMLPVECVH